MDSLVLPNLTTAGRTKEISWDGMLTCIHSTVKTVMERLLHMSTDIADPAWQSQLFDKF